MKSRIYAFCTILLAIFCIFGCVDPNETEAGKATFGVELKEAGP